MLYNLWEERNLNISETESVHLVRRTNTSNKIIVFVFGRKNLFHQNNTYCLERF